MVDFVFTISYLTGPHHLHLEESLMTITQVSRAPDTLHYYDRIGLIHAKPW